MHRRLRLPCRGEKPFFPLRTRRSTGATHRETSVRVPPPRLAAYALSVITHTPSPHYEFKSQGISSNSSTAVRFVAEDACNVYNIVVLGLKVKGGPQAAIHVKGHGRVLVDDPPGARL